MGTLSFCIFDFMTVEILDSKLVWKVWVLSEEDV